MHAYRESVGLGLFVSETQLLRLAKANCNSCCFQLFQLFRFYDCWHVLRQHTAMEVTQDKPRELQSTWERADITVTLLLTSRPQTGTFLAWRSLCPADLTASRRGCVAGEGTPCIKFQNSKMSGEHNIPFRQLVAKDPDMQFVTMGMVKDDGHN